MTRKVVSKVGPPMTIGVRNQLRFFHFIEGYVCNSAQKCLRSILKVTYLPFLRVC